MIPNNSVIVSSTEPTGNSRKKVWMQKGKNLFDGKLEVGSINNETGQNDNNSTARRNIGYIEVLPNTSYTFSLDISDDGTGIRAYDINKKFVSTIASISKEDKSVTFTTTSEIHYIRFVTWSSATKFQLEQGSTATSYEEYIEPKIYVKNGNDVYEEFIKKEDGKIIKTLESTTPSSDGEFLSGLNGITKILGFQIYNYEQWREGYLCGTLVTNKEGTSLYFLANPDNTSYYGKPIRIFYID